MSPPPPLGECSEAAARSHVGKVREINEDRFLVRSERGLWAVADGMGGHIGGGDAANTAMEELARLADGGQTPSDASLRAAMNAAHLRMRSRALGHSGVSGTTVVIAWLAGNRLSVFWAGDSRAYLLRGGAWRCLTRDHSLVQNLIDAGQITKAQAERHPQAHVITRALGADGPLTLDKIEIECLPGDRVMLCSDGISRSFDPADTATSRLAVARFADAVLDRALARDGSDNATLIAVQFNSPSTDR